jgi:FAD/FMN-containing dehydrogenase
MTDTTAALNKQIAGEVLVSGQPGYDDARAVWNAMIDRKPGLIVNCKNADDVVKAVTYARDQNLPVSIRGGGHNVAGHAVCDDGVMINLTLMRGVQVDAEKRSARVEGGATWGDVDAETQKFGLATPGGLISETGVAGLTLSGGIGWLRSAHGLCIDNMLSVEIVTADGHKLNASEAENADLFWAIRGGGGNFGVITMFEFALHPVGPQVMFCAPIYPLEAGTGPIRFWRDFLADKNDKVGSMVEFSTVAESDDFPQEYWGKRVYAIMSVYAGDADEGEKLLQPLREQGELVTDFSGQIDYCELQGMFDTLMPSGDFRCYWKSHYLSGLSDEVIDMIAQGNAQPPSPNTLSSIWNFGGATADVAADATAFGDRSMPYMLSIDSVWSDTVDDGANIDWTRSFWERMRAHSHQGRMYLNFPGQGEEGEKILEDTFGANYSRLREIKRKYDPDNCFRFNQNLKPAS